MFKKKPTEAELINQRIDSLIREVREIRDGMDNILIPNKELYIKINSMITPNIPLKILHEIITAYDSFEKKEEPIVKPKTICSRCAKKLKEGEYYIKGDKHYCLTHLLPDSSEKEKATPKTFSPLKKKTIKKKKEKDKNESGKDNLL